MNYNDINRRYTAVIREYLEKGYIIATSSMGGSQGDNAHIDLADGSEVIRVLVRTFRDPDYDNGQHNLEIVVGRARKVNIKSDGYDFITIWNRDLEIISQERFYVIGHDRGNGYFYGTREEAIAADKIRDQRRVRRYNPVATTWYSPKAMEVAKRIIRREFGVKRLRTTDVIIGKLRGNYLVNYRGRAYQLR